MHIDYFSNLPTRPTAFPAAAPATLPASTMCGALLDYITTPNKDFQPMGANMGILPRTEEINTIRDKRERYAALSQNAQNAMHAWVEEYK